MRNSLVGAAGIAAVLICTQAGLAQSRTLQFDLNNLAFQAYDAGGQPSPFNGLTHTGSLDLSDLAATSQLVAILISTAGGPFVGQPGGPWNLTDCVLDINLVNGNVTGGNFLVDINGGPGAGGDRYAATVGAVGSVSTYVGGGFKIEGLSMAGHFSDSVFGTVNVSDFFASQSTSPFLQGSFLTFRIQPSPGGKGFADTDAFVTNAPAPGPIACLIAAACVVRRRRR